MNPTQHQQTAFIGRITASATHEIRNVLAIVKESAGLVGDLIASGAAESTNHYDKVQRALGRIDAQVSRGTEVIQSLNRFAHSLDHAEDRVELNEVTRQIALLYRPFARQRRHELSVEPADTQLSLLTNQVRLEMALFAAIQFCLELLPDGTTLIIQLDSSEEGPYLILSGAAVDGSAAPESHDRTHKDQLESLLREVDARLETDQPGCLIRISFRGPSS